MFTPKSSLRIVVISAIFIAIAAIAVSANWGSGFGFELFSANSAASESEIAADPDASLVCPAQLTQSTSQTIVAGSVSCNGGAPTFYHSDNSYWRAFNMASFGITPAETYVVTSVDVGIESANANGTGTTQPLTVRLYAQTTGTFPTGTRTQIGTTTVQVVDQTLTVLNVPISAVVPAGTTEMIMEVNTPDGQVPLNSLFIGSNAAGQSAPGYISAAACSITTPTDLVTIGFPNMHMVFNVNGNCGATPTATNTPVVTSTSTNTSTPTNTTTPTNTATPTPTATANPNCSFSNGGLNPQPLTESGVAAPAGFFWSEVQHNTGNTTESNTLSGVAGSVLAASFFRLADNFTISQPCIINSVDLYSYQTGGPPASPFTAYTLQIWNGRPGDVGSTVVFGDTTTNRLLTSVDSTYFRIFNTAVPPPGTVSGTTRKIWRNTVTVGTTLAAGTYWLDWNSTVTASAAHFDPTKTIAGLRGDPLDNARQFVGSTSSWQDVIDAGNPAAAPDYPQDFPFDITGLPAGTPTSTSTASPTFTATFTPTNTATSTNTATPTPTATANPNCSFSNGGLNPQPLTDSGVAAPAGFFWSEAEHNTGNLTEANTSAGYGAIQGSNRLADNFLISQPCILNSVDFYAYQTSGPATSPFTAYTLQIWNGRPGDVGSTVVFGDTTTNRLATSVDSTYFRIFNTVVPPATAPGTTRKIWRNTLTVGTTLPAGMYWLDWASTITGGPNHFHPSKTIAGLRGDPLDNARQFTVSTSTWVDVVDTGQPATAPDYPQDFPFDISGGPVGSTPTSTATASPTPTFTATATNTATNTPTPPDTVCDLVEGFDDITVLPGWETRNNSSPVGATGWFQGQSGNFPAHSPSPVASPTPVTASYISANFNNTTGTNTISNWLMTAPVLLQDGGQLTFWTRTVGTPQFPDRLQVRMSTNGTSTNVGTLATDVGDFTTLLLDINDTYTLGGYPNDWTQFTVTLSGLGSPVKGRIAFRYFVENGGPTGANSDTIGIDTFEYHCTVAVPGSISGTITYGNAIGNPVPPRFVRNVSVASTAGAPPVGPIVTGVPGTYTLTGFGGGGYTIAPTKPSGPNNSISSADASRIAQGSTGLIPFVSNNQRFVADTSGNGAISSADASRVAQFVTGLPVTAPQFMGQWRFFISNLPAFPNVPAHPQERTYASVTSVLTGEDYIGLLIGETTGNYNPATHARPAPGPERSTTVTMPRMVTPADNEVIVPISVSGAADKEIVSYEFDLRYDPSVIQPMADAADVAGTVSRGLSVVANPYEPGLLRVAVYGVYPINENGLLMNLRFTAVGAPGTVSPLVFERIMFNEGDPGTMVTEGMVALSAAPANQAEITGRLLNSMGQGIPNARVTLTDTTGQTVTVMSNGLGAYRFGGLTVGQTYTISAASRNLAFTPLTVSVTDQSVNVDLIAE